MCVSKNIKLFTISLLLHSYLFATFALASEKTFEDYKAWEQSHESTPQASDEKDVVKLNQANFWEFVNGTKYVMVEFYAPWCGYCQALTPEYASAATELKEGGSDVTLAKVDAIDEFQLADEFKVTGFPTIYLFSEGQHQLYEGERTKVAIVSWIKKKTSVAVHNVMYPEEAAKILSADNKIVMAFVDSLTGFDSQELKEASNMEDEVNFYQTTNPAVAEEFKIHPDTKRPSLVLIKKEAEKLSIFDGNFSKEAITDFVSRKKHPLVIKFSRDTLETIFENPLNKQMLLFASKIELSKFRLLFEEAAIAFKGKLVFVYVDTDNQDFGKAMVEHFGVEGDAPRVVAYAGYLDGRKFLLDSEITSDNLKSFSENFLSDKLQPFYKSDPIPEANNDDVKIVVGKNFDEIVLNDSKDVLLEIYATWCRHCKSLEPIYNQLAKHMRGVDSITIAKMDGARNEHLGLKVDAFPTILFYPSGKKNIAPIIFDADRTASALYEFLKSHASTPFETPMLDDDDEQTLQNVTGTTTPPANNHEYKDEL